MSLKIRSIVVMFICGVLFGSFANSEEGVSSNAIKPRVTIGDRAEPLEKQISRLKNRDLREKSEDREDQESAKKHDKDNKSRNQKKHHGQEQDEGNGKKHGKVQSKEKLSLEDLSHAKRLYVTTHPAAYQDLVSVSYYGDSVELVDGSIWTISSADSYKAAHWFRNDVIVITPNKDWFSSYSFRLVNQTTGESLAANLYLGPIDPVYGSLYTYWIVGIDYYYNSVYLSDGSIWDMSRFDIGVVHDWLVNDVVIVGVNNGRLSSFNPNILINVNKLNYAAGAVSY